MKLDYTQDSAGMYKLRKSDFDDIALMILREHLASMVDIPQEVDIGYLIKDCFFLNVHSKHLSADKSVLGLVAFEDTRIPCYDLSFSPAVLDLCAGDIVVDLSLSGRRQFPRRRFTLAHELSHWILHRSYHSPINQEFALRKESYVSCDSSTIESVSVMMKSDFDREEWQANSLAASLLMPKFPFLQIAHEKLRRYFGDAAEVYNKADNPTNYYEAVGILATVFNVSIKATEIRLDNLNLLA